MAFFSKIGTFGKGMLTGINTLLNQLLRILGVGEIILYKDIRNHLLRNSKDLSVVETRIFNNSVNQRYDVVICGHTHIPKKKSALIEGKTASYINCGDWVENFTAAEYYDKNWHLYYLPETEEENQHDDVEIPEGRQLYHLLVKEFACLNCC